MIAVDDTGPSLYKTRRTQLYDRGETCARHVNRQSASSRGDPESVLQTCRYVYIHIYRDSIDRRFHTA